MKSFSILFFIIIFTVAAHSQTGLKVGNTAPEFMATDLAGNDIALNSLRGNIVVMTFWSTRCEICHVEFPKLNRLIRSFDGKKVVFLSLTMENDVKVETYLKKNPLEARIVPNSFGVLLQYADRDRNGNMDMGFPAFYVINGDGKIQYRSSGYDKTESLSSTLSKLLGSM
jgi:peroxiredoxin